jgi:hypothetical protein
VIGDKTDAVHRNRQGWWTAAGGTVTALQIDAGTRGRCRQASLRRPRPTYGGLDIAFANAGIIGDMGGIFEIEPEPQLHGNLCASTCSARR